MYSEDIHLSMDIDVQQFTEQTQEKTHGQKKEGDRRLPQGQFHIIVIYVTTHPLTSECLL
jgi:hypothetical protein